ncbi:Glycosyltransferase, GT2 family [Fontibacillus panacisegetis]|uniref:Glycosyltransferase, GT2 family n=1 Tax=Fontibacillus panacisegetis TaxID=670482 RepID=A0A1G7SYI6_9BACL|nr:glycosyltransferase family 2 protein [Fontibacillus panacisegetis]SDG28133.1 Glycosyltransferase, GT2 family [Fontibacillus panacisegetis]
MTPTVSVQIVTYNSSEDIEECLTAVLQQTWHIERILVIDNASSDHTVSKVRSFAEPFGEHIQVIKNVQNTGFAPAHNQGIHLTNTDYVLVLNPDVVLGETYVEHLISYMEQHPETGSATGRLILQSSSETIDSTGLVINKIWRAFDRGAGEPVHQWMDSAEVFGVSGAAAMYSRKMIEDISIQGEFFDADFFAYKEDVDVAWRAGQLGWKAYYCANAVGVHKRGWKKGSRSSQPLFVRRHSFINRYKMMYKNLSGYRWLRSLPQLLAYEVAVHGYMLLKEPKVLGAWIDFWRQLPSLREKRGEIRSKLFE